MGAKMHGDAPSATLGLFFLLAGYYVTYYAGVLRKAAVLGAPSPAPRLS
jgi:hypothetical protein